MNNTELESLIRTIITAQLAPAEANPCACNAQGVAIFDSVDAAVCAAHAAFQRYQDAPLKTRSAIISAIRKGLADGLADLSEQAAAETCMGNAADKILKNQAALENTPGIEDLATRALTGDEGMVLFEYSPFGVIGSVAPSTSASCCRSESTARATKVAPAPRASWTGSSGASTEPAGLVLVTLPFSDVGEN